jgi:hypothetical protein
MVTVKTTLTKFLKFLNGLEDGSVNDKAYAKIKTTLRESLDNNVFGKMQHEGNVFEIPSQTELELLIMGGGRSHKPGKPRESHYSKQYLQKKRSMNLPAHEYKQMGFRQGTEVIKENDRVVMRVPPSDVTREGHIYGIIHESKKSVLKYAFLSAWTQIIENIVDIYASELR